MKARKNLIALLFMAAMMQPFLTSAQTPGVSSERIVGKPNEQMVNWRPVKLGDKGSNVKSGVEFYNHNRECNAQEVKVLKLVNTNAYPVKVSYQISEDSPVVNVLIPASASIEGSCAVTNDNLAKLVITIPNPAVAKTAEEKQKMKEYVRSHLVITQIQ